MQSAWCFLCLDLSELKALDASDEFFHFRTLALSVALTASISYRHLSRQNER